MMAYKNISFCLNLYNIVQILRFKVTIELTFEQTIFSFNKLILQTHMPTMLTHIGTSFVLTLALWFSILFPRDAF